MSGDSVYLYRQLLKIFYNYLFKLMLVIYFSIVVFKINTKQVVELFFVKNII